MLELKESYFNHWDEFEKDTASFDKIRNSYKSYDIKYPHQLNECQPKIGTVCYLYKIHMIPKDGKKEQSEGDKVFNNLLKGNRNFGILTTKSLPKLPCFQLYLSSGQVDCQISEVPLNIRINTENDLKKLQIFQTLLFKNILETFKSFFIMDNSNTINSFLVVPILGDAIDYNLVDDFQYIAESREIPMIKRQKISFERYDYLYNVITPWYRVDPKPHYIVIDVKEHLTPMSLFPNETYGTFANYYENKYQQQILHPNQFLIEVKGITSSLNRLNPNDDGKKKKSHDSEILIPEICHNFMFPGEVWLKSVLLPSVIHRLHYMLHAENTRIAIINYIGIPDVAYETLPLDVDRKVIREDDDDESNQPMVINNSLLQPKPESVKAQNLTTDYKPLNEIMHCPWQESDEPQDLQRNWTKVHPVDIDYYQHFMDSMGVLHSKMTNLNLNIDHKIPSICDVNEKKIKLLELKTKISPQTKDLLKAITTKSSNDVFDLERFEFLGDSYLKMIVSIFAYNEFPDWHEGLLTEFRSKIISNKNLMTIGIKHEIPNIMKIVGFNPKNDWQPPLLTCPFEIRNMFRTQNLPCNLLYKLEVSEEEFRKGEISKETFDNFSAKILNYIDQDQDKSPINNFLMQQYVADKSIADAVEAILGVCVHSLGIEYAAPMLQYFNIIPKNVNINNILRKIIPCKTSVTAQTQDIDDLIINYNLLEERLGYSFKNRAYLLQALTHASFTMNKITGCYQQLEFLGDAVLDFLVASYIYENCSDMDPGDMTDLRSALVNNTTLACVAVRNKFHQFMLFQNTLLSEVITEFVSFQEDNNHMVTDSVQLLIDEDDLKMADYVDVPKVLGDVIEALIGAVFLDCGNSFDIVWNVIYKLMTREIVSFKDNIPYQLIRQLYEYPHANPNFSDPVVHEENVVMVELRFTKNENILVVNGCGRNKEDAKKSAAKLALQKLKMN